MQVIFDRRSEPCGLHVTVTNSNNTTG